MTNDYYLEYENKFVYLCDKKSRRLIGFYSPLLNTDSESIISAFSNIYPRLTSAGIDNIIKCFEIFKKNNIHIDVHSKIIKFSFYCDYFENNGGHDLTIFIDEVNRTKSYDKMLHHMFAIQIASKYVNNHNVKVNIKKNENGPDLEIDNFNCECKTRLGNFNDPKTLNEKIKTPIEGPIEYVDLTRNFTKKTVPNDIARAFSNQNADVVFREYTKTEYEENGRIKSAIGNFFYDNILTKPKEQTKPPFLRKNLIIHYINFMGKDLWYPALYLG